ncbi:P-II family nitrogen regulator [Halanaerobium saccharolyticum]|jgi:nitrogen regulatory protein P-II 1|uniref:Nitrogen regulatory protein P-II family n=1 Tax=Halanaerobium saccharolyticum TaxID=43595 RepID=A0A2T5RJQ3_9FIRM|nr:MULTISPECIES: P-II family nitrogen regulator [Halanaerobium]OEG63163.1 MAG: transcriptional regulator [Halanaerobium sp. MDAL1]PTV98904.1 nitrogen regulatory protein P-II family [Halanaerobium saccharolyticum]PUU88660.1 MAG: nitrogen regulatory protein P-II 1 [Halanaerobium sp.]PUU94401.1 MAG: nitrogen regulatory protein P-II 1 [Halanaerobium sp.]TDP88725.1 nitrogen regulatory protein P-II family [Halanaerobium saccharolyticum]
MKKIEAIIRPDKTDRVIDCLEEIGISGLNIKEIQGYGSQKGQTEMYRGVTYRIRLRKKFKVETVVDDSKADQVVKAITEAVQTGEVGDGKIFVSDVENAVRIRTGEEGTDAL